MKIFVYGTLLKGMSRFNVLAHTQFLGHGIISGILYDLGDYPGLRNGGGLVYGELYEIDQETLNTLDRIEGYSPENPHDSLYLRRKVNVRLFNDGSQEKAYTYFYPHRLADAQPIQCGDYRRYLLERSAQPQWYIAYGSNMASTRLRSRLGLRRIEAIETGYLAGYELQFNKKANNGGVYANLAYRGSRDRCPFVAYRVSMNHLIQMDDYEGEPAHYVRVGLPFPTATGTSCLGHLYIANPNKLTAHQKPAPDYLRHLRTGYAEHGFDCDGLPQ